MLSLKNKSQIKNKKLIYSFLSDTEPTDAQQESLMKEVAEDVRKKREKTDKVLFAAIKKGTESLLKKTKMNRNVS